MFYWARKFTGHFLISIQILIAAEMLLLPSSPLQAAEIVLVDFDNVVVETRAEFSGGFQSYFSLFRTAYRSNLLQPILNEPETIQVTQDEFDQIKNYIARGPYQAGSLNRKFKLASGAEITPGLYQLRFDDSYKRFRENPSGPNFLLEDFKAGEIRSDLRVKGPFFDEMCRILKDPERSQRFGIVSSRGHSRKEWQEFFQYLKDKNYIEYLPDFKLIFSLGRPEFDAYSPERNVPVQKTGVLVAIAKELARIPLLNAAKLTNRDGNGKTEIHSLIYADDDQRVLDAVVHKFRELTQSKRYPIKFTVYNFGKSLEVSNSGRPQFLVIRDDGSYRLAGRSDGRVERLTAECKARLKKIAVQGN